MEIGVIVTIVGIVIAGVISVFAVYYPIYYSKKISVCFLKSTDANRVEKLIALYCDRVSYEERIPPNHLTKSLHKNISASSIRDFRKKMECHGANIIHLPLVVEVQREIVGFLKAIYVKDQEYVFIAYLVSKPIGNYESSRITSALLTKLKKCIAAGRTIKFIAFEIVTKEDSLQHKAREKLFKHYFKSNDLHAKTINALYLMPEICSFDEGECCTYASNLYYVDLCGNSSYLNKSHYYSIVQSIYDNIYTESYKVSQPDLVRRYDEFTKEIMRRIKKDTVSKKRVELL